MSLCLMYITNNIDIAKIAEKAGVNRIFIDLEFIGKEERQKGLDTVKSRHSISDISKIKQSVNTEILVRINPIHERINDYISTEEEIEAVIQSGADILMLPMFKTSNEVKRFLNAVNGRAKTVLLLETSEAVNNLEEIIKFNKIDEIHIGINDLHLALKKKFMFELFIDGTIEKVTRILRKHDIVFGIGGIARIGHGDVPAEYIIPEHYRLGSSMAILSRSFCNANKNNNLNEVQEIFIDGVKEIRNYEKEVQKMTEEKLKENFNQLKILIANVAERK